MNSRRVALVCVLIFAVCAATFFVFTSWKEQSSVVVYGKRISDFPDIAVLTHMQAVDRVRKEVPGKLVGVRLREMHMTLMYEVEWVPGPEGNIVLEFLIDAGTGAVMSKHEISNTLFEATR